MNAITLTCILLIATSVYSTSPNPNPDEGRSSQPAEEPEVKVSEEEDITGDLEDIMIDVDTTGVEEDPDLDLTGDGESVGEDSSDNWEMVKEVEKAEELIHENETKTISLYPAAAYAISEQAELHMGHPPSTDNLRQLSAYQLRRLTREWTKLGRPCNLTRSRSFWKGFWTHSKPDIMIQLILNGSASTSGVCNGLRYERCDRLTLRCDCDKNAVQDSVTGSCILVEGGRHCNYAWLPVFKANDVKKQLVRDFRLACPPNSACFNQMGCWDSRECRIREADDPAFKPKALFSFCNPKLSVSKTQPPYLRSLLESNLKKAEAYTGWIKHGQKCKVSDNYGWSTPHSEAKELLMGSYESVRAHLDRMCDPFENEACHPEKRVCLCGQGFINQNGVCRLTPGHPCTWKPRFTMKWKDRVIAEAGLVRTVELMHGVDCDLKRGLSVCHAGKTCQQYTEENWAGSGGANLSLNGSGFGILSCFLLIVSVHTGLSMFD